MILIMKQLFTIHVDGSVINVNSWIECANYVEGGWSNGLISTSNSEMYYFLFLTRTSTFDRL